MVQCRGAVLSPGVLRRLDLRGNTSGFSPLYSGHTPLPASGPKIHLARVLIQLLDKDLLPGIFLGE